MLVVRWVADRGFTLHQCPLPLQSITIVYRDFATARAEARN